LDAVFTKLFTEPGTSYGVGFFGGEPFLNFGLMERAAARGDEWKTRGMNVRFGVTTNGTVMDDAVAAFFDRYIDTATFSIDGERKDHDRCRATRAGMGTHARVLENLRELRKKARFRLHIQSVITGATAWRVEDVYAFLETLMPNSLELDMAFVTDDNPAYIDDESFRGAVSGMVAVNARVLRGLADDGPALLMGYPLMGVPQEVQGLYVVTAHAKKGINHEECVHINHCD